MRYSKEKLAELFEAIRLHNESKTIKEISEMTGVNYDTTKYHYNNIVGKTWCKFTDAEKVLMEKNPDRLTVDQLAQKMGKAVQSVYNYISQKKIKTYHSKVLGKEQRMAKIKEMAGKFNVEAICVELGITKSTVLILAREMGISLSNDRSVLVPYKDKIVHWAATMTKKEIHAELLKEVSFDLAYSTVQQFMYRAKIKVSRKGGFQKGVYRNGVEARSFEPYREKVTALLGTMTWADIAKACDVSEGWLKKEAGRAKLKNGYSVRWKGQSVRTRSSESPLRSESRERKSKISSSPKEAKQGNPRLGSGQEHKALPVQMPRESYKRQSQKAVIKAVVDKPIVIKETAERMAEKVRVVLDSRTTVWAKPGYDIDALRKKFCGARY